MKSITVLKLKLDTTDEQKEVLASIAAACRKGRNVGAENWLLRQRGFPESAKQAGAGRPDKNGKPREKSESTKIYHAVREGSPSLNSQLHSTLAAQVNSFIGGKLDWRDRVADGSMRKRKEAILAYMMRTPFFSAVDIPVPNKIAVYTFTEKPELSFPWGSPGTLPLVVTCCMGKMPTGYKRLLREVAEGQRKLPDSRIVEKNGDWFWHLPLAFETEARSDIVATLWPTVPDKNDGKFLQSNRPFALELPGRDRRWFVGDGEYLIAQTLRLTRRRKEIGWRYRQRMGAGHGRVKVDEATRRCYEQLANIVGEVRRRIIADVVRQCVRASVGTLIYREPTLPLRGKCWFEDNGLQWDWTRLGADLKNAAARQGIEVIAEKYSMADAGYGAKVKPKQKAKTNGKARKGRGKNAAV